MINCAIDDWYLFLGELGPIEIAINLPMAFLQDAEAVDYLCQSLPDHAAFEGLIVEINGTDVVRNLALAKDIAKRLRSRKIAISLDDVGAEASSLTGLRDFPFVEVKVDQNFVKGCATDAVKQAMCCQILDLANGYGARTVAEGVETWADFLAVRDLGFDLVQGFPVCQASHCGAIRADLLDGCTGLFGVRTHALKGATLSISYPVMQQEESVA